MLGDSPEVNTHPRTKNDAEGIALFGQVHNIRDRVK